MVRKKLAVAVAAIGVLQANLVSALGLGELSLNSALNQPLNAEIQLLDTRDLDESQVKISLASSEDFARAGVSRDYFLTNLRFEIKLDDRGRGVIKITSHDPVVEPYLNFLVEARWPTGRMLREYTVLLDLPVFSDSQPTPVSAASRSALARQPAQAQPATGSAAPAAPRGSSDRQTLAQGSLQAGEKYRVRQNDTLWEIAAQSRPGNRVSVQQTMISIQRLNPNAFIGNNINRLKAGYVLRLPTEAEISDISGNEAVREVAAQNRAWRTGETTANTGGAQLDATSTAADGDDGYAEQARLSIATAGDAESGVDGEGRGAGAAALRNQLDASLETLDKTERENAELQGRLSDMESKIATLQRLLELKDDQLAALQGEMSQRQEEDTVDGGTADEAYTSPATTMEESTGDESTAEAPVPPPAAESESQPATQPPAQPPAPVPAPVAEQGLLDQLLSNPLYAGGAGLIVVALAVLLIMRKRKAAEAETDESLDAFEPEAAADAELAGVALEEDDALELGDFAGESDSADLLAGELEQEIAADNATAAEAATRVKSETGDAIAEADIYIAYGRYQQAIDLLSTAVAQEPDRSDLQVKLLEVYLETRDKPAFQQQYLKLQALGDSAAIIEVKEMLSSVDGAADWLDNLPGAASVVSDADMDAELIDDDGDTSFDPDDDLDIDLDLDNMSITQETHAVSLDEELDLDLDDGDDASITRMLDAVEESPALAESEDTAEFSLDEDLDLELDAGDESLELGEIADLDDEKPMAKPPADEGLDLDLESDADLDLELGDLDDTDLSELEAEFGDSNREPGGEIDISGDEDLADIELGDLDLSEGQTVTLDGGVDVEADLEDLDLSADLESSDDRETLSGDDFENLSLEMEESPPPATSIAAPSMDESFDENMAAATAGDEEFDFLADTDEVATKLDLARAYIDMGDSEGARDILDEVMQEGSDQQKQEAQSLLERV